ncbi:hypothetical protein VW35_12055 [Devosia soli]|uniref:Uncharacterized protein n=1 Tax=Devosia soli TaxID=361041 RepID=A0A0F5L823_9HYPH|nr:hypothetical protein VW35_12055 [Devosia soli]
MDAVLELGVQRFEYRAVLRHAAQAVKIAGRDSDSEMGLAPFAPSGMASMFVRFVDHFEVEG